MYENNQQRSTKVGAPNLEAAKDKNELSDLEKKVQEEKEKLIKESKKV